MPASDSVKVAVRVRPFNQREKTAGSKCVISMLGESTTIRNPQTGETKTFAFDHSYWSHDGYVEDDSGVLLPKPGSTYANQQTVFNNLGKGVLDNAWEGYNAALFAYGQTGSGKSYSMIGYGSNKGIVPITCGELFKAIEANKDKKKQLQVSFSMLEIYNEQVKDLLASTKQHQAGGLKIRQHANSGFYVEGLKEMPVKNYDQIEELMEKGTVNRTTASTNMNATSSRSHMVITIKFNQVFENEFGESTTKSSEISLVDLAGSERADSTGATGDRLKEGSAINQSLSTLGNVISALASGDKRVMVPYRNSALTKLLKSALGGNSKTIMIAALSPADINFDETLSTLRYADRAKKIQNRPEINESPTDKLIRELKEENAKLMKQLSGGKTTLQGGGNPDELQRMLAENERKMKEMDLTWEQRLEEARHEWQKSMAADPVSPWEEQPYITNVNEDPMLSGVLKLCFTHKNSVIGRAGHPGVNIELSGFGIQPKHAVVSQESGGIFIYPSAPECSVVVNGVKVKHKTKLQHLDRLKIGSNNLFVFIGFPSDRHKDDPQYDYNYLQTELAESEGFRPDMDAGHSKNSGPGMDTQLLSVFQEYISLLPQIAEANGISEELKKKVRFSMEIKNYTSHDPKSQDKRKEVIVKVANSDTKQVWVWSSKKFQNRKNLIDELYLSHLDGGSVTVDRLKDPFWDPNEEVFLASCHIWLQSLGYHLDIDEHLSLHNYRGKEEAVVHVKILPCSADGKNIYIDENAVTEPSDLLGKSLHFNLSFHRVMGVRWVDEYDGRGFYLSANIPGVPEPVKVKTVWGHSMAEVAYTKHFTIRTVTEEFLHRLSTDALVLEIWGTQADSDRKSAGKRLTPHHVDLNGFRSGLSYNNNNNLTQANLEEILEENRALKAENFRLKQNLENRNQAIHLRRQRSVSNSSIGEVSDEDDIRPVSSRVTRRVMSRSSTVRSISPTHSNHSPQRAASFDVELAKGLREFFRGVKGVEQSLSRLKQTTAGLEKSNDRSVLKKGMANCHGSIKSTEEQLSTVVLSLKEVVTATLRKSQAPNH